MSKASSQIGDVKILWLLLTEYNIGVHGEAPTVEIRRDRDWNYIDFDTNSFVDIGGRREEDLAEHLDNTGFYTFDFDPTTYDETSRETYTVFYRNDSTEYGVYLAEEVPFEDTSSSVAELLDDIAFLRKMLTNKTVLRKLGIGQFEQEFYDDDSTAIIRTDDIVKVSDEETRTPRP